MALSDTWLKANHGKERSRLAERGDRDGLGVRVTPKGKITFQLRFRSGGKFSRLDLGSYPLMTLKQARDEAQRLRAQHEQGHDPRIVRLLERQARTNFSTLTEPHIAEIMLGHRMPGAWQVYDHYDYLPEQAAALTAWFRKLEGLTRV